MGFAGASHSRAARSSVPPLQPAWRDGVGVLPALAGAVALALGLLVYFADRQPGSAWFLPAGFNFVVGPLFGSAAGWLPSLTHTLAFGLLTAAALPQGPAWRWASVTSWFLIDAAFEVGQHPLLAPRLVRLVERIAGTSTPASILAGYFVHGRFDVNDLIASAAGMVIAAVLLRGIATRLGERP